MKKSLLQVYCVPLGILKCFLESMKQNREFSRGWIWSANLEEEKSNKSKWISQNIFFSLQRSLNQGDILAKKIQGDLNLKLVVCSFHCDRIFVNTPHCSACWRVCDPQSRVCPSLFLKQKTFLVKMHVSLKINEPAYAHSCFPLGLWTTAQSRRHSASHTDVIFLLLFQELSLPCHLIKDLVFKQLKLDSACFWWIGHGPFLQAADQSELGSRRLRGWDRQYVQAGGCDLLQQRWIQESLCVHSLWTTFPCEQEHQNASPNSLVSLSPHCPR